MKPVLLSLAALLPLTSCVGYVRTRIDEPMPAARLEALRPGADNLGVCLAALGAPDHVYEYRGDGMALLWTWQDTDDWSVDVSIPVDRGSASFEFDMTDTDQPGCVLWFAADLVLERWRSGALGEVQRSRVRPQVLIDGPNGS